MFQEPSSPHSLYITSHPAASLLTSETETERGEDFSSRVYRER
jgi:hypothetical protein